MWPPAAVTPAETRDVAMADLDGNGTVDALFANEGPNQLFLADEQQAFRERSARLPVQSYDTRSVAAGDVDGDGDLDVLLGELTTRSHLWRNDGEAHFSDASAQFPDSVEPTSTVLLVDVDGDGDLDAIVANGADGTPRPDFVHRNDGFGTFTTDGAALPAHLDTTLDLAVGDLSGNGHVDLVTASTEIARILANDGTGIFVEIAGALGGVGANSVDVADTDLDGDLDVLITSDDPEPMLFVLANDGLTFTIASTLSLGEGDGVADTDGLRTGDLDGDGATDLVVAYHRPGPPVTIRETRLYPNDGAGGFSSFTAIAGAPFDRTLVRALVDVDGDSDRDLVLGNELFLNDGNGTMAEANPVHPFVSSGATAIDDFDGDGDLDVLALEAMEFLPNSTPFSKTNRFYRNQGLGVFELVENSLPFHDENALEIETGDLDLDGDLDAFVLCIDATFGPPGYSLEGEDRLLLNEGDGLFSDASANVPDLGGIPTGSVLADLDGDSDEDLVVTHSHLITKNLYLRNRMVGSADFRLRGGVLPDHTYSDGVVAGDIDLDGDVDLYIGPGQLLRNDGFETFVDVTLTQLLDSVGHPERFSDIDADGDLDLLGVGSILAPSGKLVVNDGSGSFVPAGPNPLLPTLWEDVDADGDLDAIGAQGLFLNDGTGTFADRTDLAPQRPSDSAYPLARAASGDLDGDGDLDFVEDHRVLWNMTRHLAWRALPRIGYPLRMDVSGPPTTPWLLYQATALDPGPLPPFGTLWLDPTDPSFVVLGSGVLNHRGSASLTVSVPDVPGLVGSVFYWQALVGDPARLTNALCTVITDL